MARRRVNLKFVIGLSAILLLLAAGVVWRVVIPYIENMNPAKLADKAETLLKEGDLESAIRMYGRAANAANAKHMSEAGGYWVRLAELYYDAAEKDKQNVFKGIQCLRQALIQDPGYYPAQKKLTDEMYQFALMAGDQKSWDTVEQESTKLLALDSKDAFAYVMRADSILRRITIDEMSADRQELVQKDLDEAKKLKPEQAEIWQIQSRYWLSRAALLDTRQNPREANELRKTTLDSLKEFCKQYPQNAIGWTTLAQTQIVLKDTAGTRESYNKALEAGAENADILRTVAFAAAALPDLGKSRADVEAIFKKVISLEPKILSNYIFLASYYQQNRQLPAMIDILKEGLNNKTGITGLKYLANLSAERSVLLMLAQAHMDQAQDNQTDNDKEHIQQARFYVDRLRGLQANDPVLDMLDGRLLMLSGQTTEAISRLRRADSIYQPSAQNREWLTNKILLAQGYERIRETGSAIQCWQDILNVQPGSIIAILSKARLDLQIGQYDRAIAAIDVILKADPQNETAIRLKAQAYAATGRREESQALLKTLASADVPINVAKLQLAAGETQAAVDTLAKILKETPDDSDAMFLSAVGQVQLASKLDAKQPDQKKQADALKASAIKLLDRLVAKHPENLQFKTLQTQLENPEMTAVQVQQQIIESIENEYDRNLAWSQYYRNQNDADKEVDYLKKAETNRPDSPEVIDRLFTAAVVRQNWEMAETYAQKAQRLNLDGVNGKLYDGRLLMERGRKQEAMATLQNVVSNRPDFSMAHAYLGAAYLQNNRESQAVEELQRAVEQRPDNMMALKLLINVYVRRGDRSSIATAQRYLDQALRFAPNDPQLSSYTDMIGDPKAGIQRREAVRSQHPDDEENLNRLSILYIRNGDMQKAIELTKPLWDKNPSDVAIGDRLARLYRETGQTQQALAIYQQMVTTPDEKNRYQAYRLLAEMYRSLGQLNEAIATLQMAIKNQPEGQYEAERSLGDLYYEMGDLDKAESRFAGILSRYPEDVTVQRRLAEMQIRQNKFAEADTLISKMVKANAKDPDALNLQGFLALQQKHFPEAIKAFSTVLDGDADNSTALELRALAIVGSNGDMEQAISDLKRARNRQDIRDSDRGVAIRMQLAGLLRQQGYYQEGVKEYEDIIDTRPDLISARLGLASYLFSLAQTNQKMSSASTDRFAVAIRQIQPVQRLQTLLADSQKRFPNQPVWAIRQGDLLALLDQKDQALAKYRSAYNDSNQSLIAADAYASALIQASQYAQAIEVADQTLAKNPEAVDLYLRRATAYAASNKQVQALGDYDKVFSVVGKNLSAFMMVSGQMQSVLPPDVVITYLKERIAKDASERIAKVALTNAYLMAKRPADALATIKPLMTDADSPTRMLELRVAGLAAYQAKDFDLAQMYYTESLKLQPDDMDVLNNLAFMLADDMKKPKEAIPYAERAVEILKARPTEFVGPSAANIYDTLGWIRFLSGDTTGAVQDLKRAIQIDPIPAAYVHMGQAYLKAGDKRSAKQMLDTGLKIAQERKDMAMEAEARKLLQQVQ